MNKNTQIKKIIIIASIALIILGGGMIARAIRLIDTQPAGSLAETFSEDPKDNREVESADIITADSEEEKKNADNEIGAEVEENDRKQADQEAAPKNPGYRIISGEDALALYEANPEEVTLLDVRSMDEYAMRYVAGSIVIPLDELESRLDELPDKNITIIVFCNDGELSRKAYDILISSGYYNIYDMQKIENWPSHFGSIQV